jgi:hypothetical protein
VITVLNLGTVRQNQDAEKRLLCRKSERRGWRKREGLAKSGENGKNAGEKNLKKLVLSLPTLPERKGSRGKA